MEQKGLDNSKLNMDQNGLRKNLNTDQKGFYEGVYIRCALALMARSGIVISLQTFFGQVELASQRGVVVWWQQGRPPIYLQQSAGGQLVIMRRVSTEGVSCHYLASNTRLEADPVWLESVEWWLEVGCWPPKPVKQNISRHRGGPEDKRVGSVVACPWRPAAGPPCNPPLSHPEGEGGLADQGQLTPGGPPAGRWCYVCRGWWW